MNFRRLAVSALCLFACSTSAHAQNSSEGPWWPSEWGADDERGAANRLTPAKLREATALIREGRIYELGRDYEAGMPLFPGRHYSLTIPGSPTHGPFGENQVVDPPEAEAQLLV